MSDAADDGDGLAVPDPFAPTDLGPIRLRNRIVRAATFEGMTPGGRVTDALVDYHRRPAAGGVAMTTLAYCAVSSEGRTYRDQIVLDRDAVPGLRRLTDAVHAEGAAVAAQLGHAGSFANARATREPAVAPSRALSPLGLTVARPLDDAGLGRLVDAFRRAARCATAAGFDAIELHMGHGYLLSQFLSPNTNRRRDRWGGDVAGRSRFPRRVAAAVREEVGDGAAVYAKLNMTDGTRRGLTVDDALVVAQLLAADGALDALELTAGSTSRSPFYLMRGDVPLAGMLANESSSARRLGMRLAAPLLLRHHPFEEAYLRPHARRFLAVVDDLPLILLGGVTRVETVRSALAEGFALVAMARALLHTPDLVRRFQVGEDDRSGCIHCNECIVEMERRGTRCVEVDAPQPQLPADPSAAGLRRE